MAQRSILPDLARYKCTHFRLTGKIPSRFGSVPLQEVVGQRVTRINPIWLTEDYSATGRLHRVTLVIHHIPRRANELLIDVRFHPPSNEEVDEALAVTELMLKLAELRFESEFSYDIVFALGTKASQMIFPWKLPFLAYTIMDEVRGIRGVKHQGGKIAYKLSIESPELKELYVNVEMVRKEVFNPDLLHQTVREAAGIVAGIIPESEWSE